MSMPQSSNPVRVRPRLTRRSLIRLYERHAGAVRARAFTLCSYIRSPHRPPRPCKILRMDQGAVRDGMTDCAFPIKW
jgi:hypothetical protein